jgi:hypothetical protein
MRNAIVLGVVSALALAACSSSNQPKRSKYQAKRYQARSYRTANAPRRVTRTVTARPVSRTYSPAPAVQAAPSYDGSYVVTRRYAQYEDGTTVDRGAYAASSATPSAGTPSYTPVVRTRRPVASVRYVGNMAPPAPPPIMESSTRYIATPVTPAARPGIAASAMNSAASAVAKPVAPINTGAICTDDPCGIPEGDCECVGDHCGVPAPLDYVGIGK